MLFAVSGGGMVSIQVGSSLTFLHRFKCQQGLRLARLFTECSFLTVLSCLKELFQNQEMQGSWEQNYDWGEWLSLIIAEVAPVKLLYLAFDVLNYLRVWVNSHYGMLINKVTYMDEPSQPGKTTVNS